MGNSRFDYQPDIPWNKVLINKPIFAPSSNLFILDKSINGWQIFVIFYITIQPKIWRLLILVRSRILTRLPVIMGESFFSCERPSSSAFMRGNNVASPWWETIKICIRVRSWSIFDGWETWRCQAHTKFRAWKFADFSSKFGRIQFYSFIGARPWCIFIRKMALDWVNSFGSDSKRGVVVSLLFEFILHKWKSTAPTPGWLWIWGIK